MPGKKYYFWRTVNPNRLKWAKLFLAAVMSVFTLRLFQLQILQGNYYYSEAEENRIQYYNIPAPRGRLFDRNGLELAGNQPSYSLLISPQGLSNIERERIIGEIQKLTARPAKELKKNLEEVYKYPFGVVNIASYLKRDEIIKIEENMHHLPGVTVQIEPRRRYRYGENGSHLLGYIGEIDKRELAVLKGFGYKMRDRVGKFGLEKVYDRVLRGRDGYRKVEVGAGGKHRKVLSTLKPQIGNDLLLTLDWELQQAARKTLGDRPGAVVAMNPKTGEILVWLSQPGFNPEDFTMPLTKEKADRIFNNPLHPLFDRVIQGQYAPGSIFKIVTAVAALESGEFSKETSYTCNGFITIGFDNKVYRCWKNKKHGQLKLIDAIANSCNVYFYQLGMAVGPERIKAAAENFGLGKPSQKIFSREKSGLIPSPEWKKKNFGIGWYPGDSANMSVGQGFVLVNPFQLLRLVSTVASEGKIYRPYVVKMIISPEGRVIEKNSPKLERELNISKETFEIIKTAMKGVVEYGTAQWLNLPLKVAGKTGTAENPAGDDHAWFACFAPYDDPEIAIVVLVENGGYGSTAAMPVAREILRTRFLK